MVRTSPCPLSEDLQRFLLGQLSEAEAVNLECHLAGCRRCVAQLETLRPPDRLVDVVALVARGGATPPLEVDEVLLGALYRLPQRSTGLLGETLEATQPSAPLGSGTPFALDGALPAREKTADLASFLDPAQEPGELGRFGPYSIVRVLGTGGMGIVFEARQRQPRRVVALKMILAGRGADRQRLARFHSETEIIAQLQHPNIVPIYEVGEDDGRPYFTMEYVAGGSLAGKLTVALLVPRVAAELVEILARTVHFAHEQGVVHRDLKPSNVLLTDAGVPKVVDFGLAKQFQGESGSDAAGGQTEIGAILGTPTYMAPEQAAGRSADAGPSVDVYALGAILYECLTGRPPFRAATMLETLEQVRSQEPVAPTRLQPGVPRDLQTICLKCLHKDPRRRYASAEELADDLGRSLRGEPIEARPVSVSERMRKWVRRKPALAALVAVSVLGLAALLAGGVVYERRLRAAWAAAEANADDARRQKERAVANYRQARETLGRILQITKDRASEGLPRLHELQRRQNEEAIVFYRKLAEQTGDDPEIRQDRASAQREAGLLQYAVGRRAEARKSLESARAGFLALRNDFPEELNYRMGLASCLTALGAMGPSSGQDERCSEEALALSEALVRDLPNQPACRTALAVACNQMAIVRAKQHRLDEAAELYRRAIALREEVLRDHPDDRQLRSEIVETCVNLSQLCYEKGDRQTGKHLHDRAEAEFGRLIADDPDGFSARTGLATLRIHWAYVLRDDQGTAAAIAELAKNVPDLEALLRLEPNARVVRDLLYRTYGLRGEMYAGQQRYAEALADRQKMVEYATGEEREVGRLFLAMAYAQAGRHDEAVREAEALAAQMTAQTPLDHRLHLSYVCGVAAKAVRRDLSLAESARRQRAAHYISRGLGYLREARKTISAEDWLRQKPEFLANPDLAPLREDARWQELFKP